MALSSVLQEEILRALNDLSPEAVTEVRQFVEFLKFKAETVSGSPPVAIGGWLKGYRFTNDEIAQARAEMWARVQDNPA